MDFYLEKVLKKTIHVVKTVTRLVIATTARGQAAAILAKPEKLWLYF
jgi:hypothetical protein